MRQIHLKSLLLAVALSAVSIASAQDPRFSPTNWNVTSMAFSNPPFWLVPGDRFSRLVPLENGHWIWTTNLHVILCDETRQAFGAYDADRERRVLLEWQEHQRRIFDVKDPPGLARVAEYRKRGWDQKRIWETNAVLNWSGVWTEDTNTGWRVQLRLWQTNTGNGLVWVQAGSAAVNSGAGLLTTPDGKYARLELVDGKGEAVPTRKGAAQILYWAESLGRSSIDNKDALGDIRKNYQKWYLNCQPPSDNDSSVTRVYPDMITDLEYMRHRKEWHPSPTGSFIWNVGFASNGPPCMIGWFRLNDIFAVKTEGDYDLTVQPVLFRMHHEGGIFQGYLDRIDLPCVTTKVHLIPVEK